MRTTFFTAATILMASVLGCQASSPRGGGEAKSEGFRVVVPADVQIKQGEVRSVSLSIQRDDYFKRDVHLAVDPSDGIDVNPRKVVVRASDKPDTQIRIAVGKDAAIGEYRVYVKGTPENGQPTAVEFKVKVTAP